MADIIIEKNHGIDDADVKVTLTGDAAAVVRAMSALAGASQTRVTEALIRAALKSGVVITGDNKVTFPAGATIEDLKEKASIIADAKTEVKPEVKTTERFAGIANLSVDENQLELPEIDTQEVAKVEEPAGVMQVEDVDTNEIKKGLPPVRSAMRKSVVKKF